MNFLDEKNNPLKNIAVITGAASGIGEIYAKKLAERGYNLLLIDKDKDGLKKVSSEIKKTNNIEIGFIVADLSTEKDIINVSSKLKNLKISFLINNAGFGIAQSFTDTEPELLSAIIKVHVDSTVRFTRAVLPNMWQTNEGTIINISSMAIFFKNRKNNTIYESTKTFVLSFSEALAKEVEGTKIKIQVVCPGYTRTNFMTSSTVKGRDYSMIPSWMWMNPVEVVEESLHKLNKKKILVIPGRVNKIIVCLLKSKILAWMPISWVSKKSKRLKD